jgi:hypothetical protein
LKPQNSGIAFTGFGGKKKFGQRADFHHSACDEQMELPLSGNKTAQITTFLKY